jgi:predicted transposase/invertase (TIGR01784 family)
MTRRIPPTNDLIFKKVFSHADILQGIIGDVFDIRPEVGDITITAPYSIKAYKELLRQATGTGEAAARLRQTIPDISADIKSAGMGAEIQLKKDAYFTPRSLYYTFDMFCGNYNRQGAMRQRKGGSFYRYSSLKPVYTLNILGYPHFGGDNDVLRVFTLYDRKRDKSFDVEYVTVAYFELTKPDVETANQRHWQTYFKTGEAQGDAPEYIRKAAQLVEIDNLEPEEREMIDQLEKAQEVYESTIDTAYLDGMEEGEARGAGKKQIEIVRRLLGRNRPMDEIAEDTGMSPDEIKRLMH